VVGGTTRQWRVGEALRSSGCKSKVHQIAPMTTSENFGALYCAN
jgi:hypothetical protein